jgi:hypothetical protein
MQTYFAGPKSVFGEELSLSGSYVWKGGRFALTLNSTRPKGRFGANWHCPTRELPAKIL